MLRQLTATTAALARARGERDPAVVDIRAAGELLTPLARRCGTDLERFLAEIGLGAETDALDPRADAITLLTLHGAKGLEFDVVFLAGCERGLLPLRLPGSGPLAAAEEAEERRLLFVGMTRARGKLLLSCAARRTRHALQEPAGRSPFLAAVDPGLLGPAARPREPAGPLTASYACCELMAWPPQVPRRGDQPSGSGGLGSARERSARRSVSRRSVRTRTRPGSLPRFWSGSPGPAARTSSICASSSCRGRRVGEEQLAEQHPQVTAPCRPDFAERA